MIETHLHSTFRPAKSWVPGESCGGVNRHIAWYTGLAVLLNACRRTESGSALVALRDDTRHKSKFTLLYLRLCPSNHTSHFGTTTNVTRHRNVGLPPPKRVQHKPKYSSYQCIRLNKDITLQYDQQSIVQLSTTNSACYPVSSSQINTDWKKESKKERR